MNRSPGIHGPPPPTPPLRAASPGARRTTLLRPIARLPSSSVDGYSSSSCGSCSNSIVHGSFKKRAIRSASSTELPELVPEPSPLRRQVATHAFMSWNDASESSDWPTSNFVSIDAMAWLQTIPGGLSGGSGDDASRTTPLFGTRSQKSLFLDSPDDAITASFRSDLHLLHAPNKPRRPHHRDSELEVAYLTQPRKKAAVSGKNSVAVTPSPHPFDVSTALTSDEAIRHTTNETYRKLNNADTFVGPRIYDTGHSNIFHQEGFTPFQNDYESPHAASEAVEDSMYPLIVKLPGFIPQTGATIQDVMDELIYPTPDASPPSSCDVQSTTSSDIFGSDMAVAPGMDDGDDVSTIHNEALAGWFGTNPALGDVGTASAGNSVMPAAVAQPEFNCQAIAPEVAATGDHPFFLANNSFSSAFAPGQVRGQWRSLGGYGFD